MKKEFKISKKLYLDEMNQWPDKSEFNLLKGTIENFIHEYSECVSRFSKLHPLPDGFYEIENSSITDELVSGPMHFIEEGNYFYDLSIYDLLEQGEKLGEIIVDYRPQSTDEQKAFARFLSSYHSLWFLINSDELNESKYYNDFYIYNIDYWYRKLKQNLSSIDNTVFKFIHPDIKKVSIDLFKGKFYRHAVLDSFIEVIHRVKEISVADEGLEGINLIENAIQGTDNQHTNNKKKQKKVKQVLKFNDLSNRAEKNEQDGIINLFQGVVRLRNKDAHLVTFQQNDNHALGYIMLSSLLMYLLDDVEDKKGNAKRRTKRKPDKRIKSMIERFDIAMKGIDSEIEIEQKKHYKAYVRLKNIFCLVPFANKVTLYTNLFSVQELSDNFAGKVRDVSDIGHLGTGNTEITIKTVKDLEKFIEEIRKKYKKEDSPEIVK